MRRIALGKSTHRWGEVSTSLPATPKFFQSGFLPMNLFRLLQARHAAGKPVRVALIGAGKFGSMFLSQVPYTSGLEVPVIVDLDPDRARDACRAVGWDAARIAATTFTSDAAKATSGNIDA